MKNKQTKINEQTKTKQKHTDIEYAVAVIRGEGTGWRTRRLKGINYMVTGEN